MASLNEEFDANTVEPNSVFEVIPDGEYKAQIINSEKKTARTGSGDYLKLELEITEGPYKGRKVWANLNLWSTNEQAREISYKSLSAICHAVGVLRVTDSEQLHFKQLVIVVKAIPAEGKYDAKNEVKAFKAATGAPIASPPKPSSTPASSTQPGSPVPPWKRAAG